MSTYAMAVFRVVCVSQSCSSVKPLTRIDQEGATGRALDHAMALNCGTFGLSQKSLPLGEFLLLLSNAHRLLNSSVHFKKHACWKYSIYLNRPPSGHRVMNSGKNANQVCVQRSRENLTFQSIALSMIYFTHM